MGIITVSITPDEGYFLSHCLEYDIASQGESRQEALDNIKEAVSLFLEAASPDEIESRLTR
ncbi:MAG: type II toxin-antitoxin system HicB family antitoxin [Chloroflexi bacterium]|nr:type II toxin-antitoxin system HicB family antitoxin [Chloroflexota bacterium]MCY3582658.1 type II toxin-antitoxin system HicB family antitoxin [Chloroflexota bacterium]MCY3717773.1 type II toxin-antitoxin system HicB family antitoxin [Chloroflexota bacterium]MDE2651474.1 type II toxin-antitoxin system HicB family antitoxin [Chloroflexota bacterium]MXX50874.1 type II toxin-antitoxin system HicB family antitoxin [Chloroflexota bacterium]